MLACAYVSHLGDPKFVWVGCGFVCMCVNSGSHRIADCPLSCLGAERVGRRQRGHRGLGFLAGVLGRTGAQLGTQRVCSHLRMSMCMCVRACMCACACACSVVRSGSPQASWESEKQVQGSALPPLLSGLPGKPPTSHVSLLWSRGAPHPAGREDTEAGMCQEGSPGTWLCPTWLAEPLGQPPALSSPACPCFPEGQVRPKS